MVKRILIIVNHPKNLLIYRHQFMLDLQQRGYAVSACAPYDRVVADKLHQMNVKFIPIKMQTSGISPIRDSVTLFRLFRIIKKYSPTIIINYTIKPTIYGSIAARLCGIRRIYSVITGLGYVFSNNDKVRLIRKLVQLLYKISLRYNKKVFFQNPDDIKLFVINKLLDANKSILINGSGVDLQKFQPVAFPDKCCFLLISRLLKSKGIFEYVEAANIIKQKYPKVQFKFIGGWAGNSNPETIEQKQVDELRQNGAVEFLDVVDDIRPIIKATTVYVLPSFYREGTPRSILESMAMGKPIITTDMPGCREAVKHGVNGYLVPAKNVKKLAAAMEKFILQPELAVKMGKESRKIAEEKYDVHKVNGIILDALEDRV